MSTPIIEHLVPQAPGTHRFVNMLDGLDLSLFLGIHPPERAARQRVRMWVQLVCDYAAAPTADRIEEVADYDFLRAGIHALAQERRFDLQETLCEAVAELCWRSAPVTGVLVQSLKTDIYPDAEIGCRIIRLRPAGR